MGCTIAVEKKINPSVYAPRKRKDNTSNLQLPPTENPSSTKPALTPSYIEPTVNIINSKTAQPLTGKALREKLPPLNLDVHQGFSADSQSRSKHFSRSAGEEDSYHENQKTGVCNPGIVLGKQEGKATVSATEDISSKRAYVSTRNSIPRLAFSMVSIDLNEGGNPPKSYPSPMGVSEVRLPSKLLTNPRTCNQISRGTEERPSIEEIESIHGKKTVVPSFGLVEDVEEVNISREINLKNGSVVQKMEEHNSIELESKGQDVCTEERPWGVKPIEGEGQDKEECSLRISNVENNVESRLAFYRRDMPEEFIIKNISRHILHPAHNKEEAKHGDVKETAEEKMQGSLVPPKQEEKIKARMKAKFTRNLIELVARSENMGAEDENVDPNRCLLMKKQNSLKRMESLSLVYCPPDEAEEEKPHLDLKMMEVFRDAEGFSPIGPPNKFDYGEMTPFVALENSVLKKKMTEFSTVVEDRTDSDIEEELSESDLDDYSFVAEVKEIEIDEKNNYNIYRGGQVQILQAPHSPAKKSTFVNKELICARNRPLRSITATDIEREGYSNRESRLNDTQSIIESQDLGPAN